MTNNKQSNYKEVSMHRIHIGEGIFKLVVSLGDKNADYVMQIMKPCMAHIERHCSKTLVHLMTTRDNSEDELQETYDTVINNLALLPRGQELGEILTYEHFRLMIRYMVYRKRAQGESNDGMGLSQEVKL